MLRWLNLALVVAALGTSACWLSDLVDFHSRLALIDPDLVRLSHQRGEFAPHYEWLCDQLAHGALSLPEAARQIREHAARVNPKYLTYVDMGFFEGDVDTKVAFGALSVLKRRVAFRLMDIDRALMARLEEEYELMRTKTPSVGPETGLTSSPPPDGAPG